MTQPNLKGRSCPRDARRSQPWQVFRVGAAWLLLQPAAAVAQTTPDGVDGGTPDWERSPVEFGARFGFLELEDTDSGQTLPMGGLGGYARVRLSRRIGIEASLDAYMADQLGQDAPGEVVSMTMPVAASALFYLFPESEFSLYFLGGIGVAAHVVRYEALGVEASWATPLAQLGLGVQYRLDELRFDLSVRSLVMNRSADAVRIDPILDAGVGGGANYQPRTDERNVMGGLVTLGIHWAL